MFHLIMLKMYLAMFEGLALSRDPYLETIYPMDHF